LLELLPFLHRRLYQGRAFCVTLLWGSPLGFTSTQRNAAHENAFHDAQVMLHLRREE
jgi:hypothetical protein